VAPVGLPLAFHLLRARRWRDLAIGAAACAILAVALYAPFWFGPGTLGPLVWTMGRAQWSVGAGLLYASTAVVGSAPEAAVRLLLITTCSTLLIVCLRGVPARRPSVEHLTGSAAVAVLVVLLAVPLVFYSHYLTPVIALAAVASDTRIRPLAHAISFGAMVNAVLGADSLTGGLSGHALDVVGSGVLVLMLLVGLVWMRASARRYEPATPQPAVSVDRPPQLTERVDLDIIGQDVLRGRLQGRVSRAVDANGVVVSG
jgi:hypothetical protein